MTTIPSPLERTRRSLHAVAEHVLGAALHAATGRIGLRAAPGGFATPAFPGAHGQRRVGVDGTDLVVSDGDTERRSPLTTIGAAAALVGIRPGAPVDVYTPSTPLEPDRPLDLDLASAHLLAAFFAATDDSLARLATAAAADTGGEPAVAQLWPEHLDLALTLDEVNYGGSPGDDEHPLPYLYVGPWTAPTDGDPFWNEPFGASTTVASNLDPATALAFFADGRRRLGR
jgi:hypothetical protein